MKFTKPDNNGILSNKFFDTYQEAKEYYKDHIVPVVGLKEWKKMSDEHKIYKNGEPHCLYFTDQEAVFGKVYVVYEI